MRLASRLGTVSSSQIGVVTLLSDTWTGSNGASWDTTKWPTRRETFAGAGTSTFDIQSNAGRSVHSQAGAPSAFNATDIADFDLTVKVACASALAGRNVEVGWRIGANITSGAPTNGYVIQTGTGGGGRVDVYKVNAYSSIANASATALNAVVTAWFRILVVGTAHKVKWWLDGAAEPGTWNIEVTDATYTTGRLMLRHYGGTTAVTWDDLTVIAP